MPSSQILIRLTTYSLMAFLYAVPQATLAHTIVRDSVTGSATSSTSSSNAFVITHGCAGAESGPKPLPVLGQSAVFPFGRPDQTVWVRLGTPNTPIDPVTVIGGDGILTLGVAGVQDASVFATQTEEINPELGDPPGAHNAIPVHALNWRKGSMIPSLNAYTQFRVSVPPVVNNCVSKLRIRIAVANWCEKKQNEATDGNNNRSDWWFTAETGTQKFTDPDIVQPSFWSTLTVNNPDATDANCPADQRFEVAVMPSGADIDKYLPLKGFTKGPAPY